MKIALVSFLPSLTAAMLMMIMFGCQQHLMAQNKDDGEHEIKLSDNFLKALEGAFLFEPVSTAPISYPDPLTREQLHEWVGPVDTTDTGIRMELWHRHHPDQQAEETQPQDTTINPNRQRYLAIRAWEKNFQIQPPTAIIQIDIPGLSDHVQWQSADGQYSIIRTPDGRSALSGLDVNALGQYVRPKEIRKRRSRNLTKKKRGEMDLFYPIIPNPE